MYLLRTITICITAIAMLSCIPAAFSQNLNGEKIKVSPESITALKFNSTIMDYQWSNPSGYTCIARNNDNTLLIKTLNDHPDPTNLIVSEGKRTHYFIIDFLPKININETKLYYDYSDLKQLKKLAQNSQAGAVNDPKEEKEMSPKEKKQLEKEEDARKKAAEDKRKQEEAERQRLAAEQQQQIEKLKQQEQAEAAERKEKEEEKQRIAAEQKQKEEEERQRKEQERLAEIEKQQEKLKAEQEQQKQ